MTKRLKGIYSVQKELFRDSISRTFAATGVNDTPVLITQYDPRFTQSPLIQPLIERCERLINVQIPQVSRLIDYHFDGTSFFSIYAVTGGITPLLQRLKQTAHVDISQLLRWCTEILKSLDQLQRHGVYHGNISLHSVHIDEANRVTLMHTLIHEAVITHTMNSVEKLDCALFLSPEQLQGTASGFQSDIYGFGILIYLLFSNSWPYEFTTEVARVQSFSTMPPRPFSPINAQLPPYLDQIIAIAIAKHPSERFRSIEELARRFSASPLPDKVLKPVDQDPAVADKNVAPTLAKKRGRIREWIGRWSSRRTHVAIAIALGVVLLGIANHGLVSYVTAIPESTVPDVHGLPQAEAIKMLETAHLRGKIGGIRVDYTVDAGSVIETRPPSGRAVKEHRIVLLYIAKHNSEYLMPDLVGHSIEEAQSLLTESKSPITVTEEINSLSAPDGEILAQSPTPNTQVGAKTPILVTLSKGFPISVQGTQFGQKCTLVIQLSVAPTWPAQTVKITLKQHNGTQILYTKILAPGESANLTYPADMSGELFIYFNSRSAYHHTIKDVVTGSSE